MNEFADLDLHPSLTEDELNKDLLLMKCKEVIESLNTEIEEEKNMYKTLESEFHSKTDELVEKNRFVHPTPFRLILEHSRKNWTKPNPKTSKCIPIIN